MKHYFTHLIAHNTHSSFLKEGRKDPVTGEQIKAGDTVVICAHCKSAFLQKSWEYMGGEHCGQSNTLEVLLNTKGKLVGGYSDKTNTAQTKKVPTQKTSINWTLVIIAFLLSTVAIVYILNTRFNTNNSAYTGEEEATEEEYGEEEATEEEYGEEEATEEEYGEEEATEEEYGEEEATEEEAYSSSYLTYKEKEKLKSIVLGINEISRKKYPSYAPDFSDLRSFYDDEIEEIAITVDNQVYHRDYSVYDYVKRNIKVLRTKIKRDSHQIDNNNWVFDKTENTYKVSFVYKNWVETRDGESLYIKSKRTYKMNESYKIFYVKEEYIEQD